MFKRIFFLTVLTLAFIGAGCTRISSTDSSLKSVEQTTQPPEAAEPRAATPRAEAPAIPVLLPSSPQDTTSTKPTAYTVTIRNFSFFPAEVRIKVGDVVLWQQQDSARHNVVADDGSFRGPLLSAGEMYTHTFAQKGTFSYYCEPHPWMKGKIIVE